MSRTFKVEKKYYSDEWNLFNRTSVTIESGFTALIGCNGSGKSTLLRNIKLQLEKENVPCICYDNYKDGGLQAKSEMLFYGDPEYLAASFNASEGEQIVLNLGRKVARETGSIIRENPGTKELWILLDACDSGLSIDNIIEFKEFLKSLPSELGEGADVYIVAAANEYELACGEMCLGVYDLKYRQIRTYNEYRKYILYTAKKKILRDNQ